MEIELIEVRDFIVSHSPFDIFDKDDVDAGILDSLTNDITIRYFRRGMQLAEQDLDDNNFYLLRSGAIEFQDANEQLLDKLAEGQYFFQESQSPDDFKGVFVEDTLIYLIPFNYIDDLRKQYKPFNVVLSQSINKRLRHAVKSTHAADMRDLSSMKLEVCDLTDRLPVIVDASTSIQQAAALMTSEQVSSILVTENEQLKGMLTDRDIRSRCVAKSINTNNPIREIMTTDLETVTDTTLLSAAILSMTRKQIHHLPILKKNKPIGMLTTSDIVRHLSASPTMIASDIYKANSVESLKKISARLPELQLQLSLSSATAKHIGEVLSSMTDAITTRLINLAEENLGEAPVNYVWLAGGSQARNEQTSHSDQDNALIISNDLKPEDEDYFKKLANFVCDGLNECGYIYCPGNAMASNDEWRQPIKVWKGYFKKWIGQPEPKSLMLSSIFFDLRPVHGDKSLFSDLHGKMLDLTKNNELFISHMVGNALTHKPPLGFFRTFLLVQNDKDKKRLDMKHRGIVPIVDIARVLALDNGIVTSNTVERLHEAKECKALSREMHDNLIDALEFISSLRIRHQAKQIRAGLNADNYLPIEELSGLEKTHLKDIFSIIKTMQQFFEVRYPSARMS